MLYAKLDKAFPFSFHTRTVSQCERVLNHNFREDYLYSRRRMPVGMEKPEFDVLDYFKTDVREHLDQLARGEDFVTGVEKDYLNREREIHFYVAFATEELAMLFRLAFL